MKILKLKIKSVIIVIKNSLYNYLNMHLIVAVNQKNVIGINNKIPWYIPEDLKYFKELTNNHIIVMGRKTYESLPKKPLPNRIHVVITSQPERYDNTENVIFIDIENAIECITQLNNNNNKKVFVIGGSSIYQYFFQYCTQFHITNIFNDCEGDTFFPYGLEIFKNTNKFENIYSSTVYSYENTNYQFQVYKTL